MKAELDAPAHGELWLRDAVGHDVGATLTKPEALAVTAKIKGFTGVAWILLLEAHNRQAHKAMGYKSWATYVRGEFDIGRSRSYQLISQAKFILELNEKVSTDVDISEAMARDLAPLTDEAKATAIETVEALPADATPEDKTDAVQEALDRLRTTAVEAKRPKAPPKIEPGEAATSDGAEARESEVRSAPPAETSPGSLTPARDDLPPVDMTRFRSAVEAWIAFDRQEQAIDEMTDGQQADYRTFLLSVFNHASTTIDYLDKSHLKAVPS